MPLLFVISGGWKALSDLVKKRRAIAADQRGSVRASASRDGGYPGIALRFFATACTDITFPDRVRETLTYFGQRFAHIALPKP